MLHVNGKLLIQLCLAYLPGPNDKRLLRIGKVSVTASDVRNVPEKIQFRPRNRNSEKFIDISERTKTRNLLKMLPMLRYLRKVQRISGEFLAERSPYILCCDWNFSPQVFFSSRFYDYFAECEIGV